MTPSDMDGLTALTEIHRLYPQIPVIMFSTLTQRGAVQTINALTRGAADYVAKPANVGSVEESIAQLTCELIPKILAFTRRSHGPPAAASEPPNLCIKGSIRPSPSGSCDVLAIASSTGGPSALQVLFSAIPEDFPVPILVVQHMPPLFTGLLARRLNDSSRVSIVEASEGQTIERGCAYLAPGGKHLEARPGSAGAITHLHEGMPENSCRPAADVLFRSVAQIWGERSLCVVLTGMGRDGMQGARMIHDMGGTVIAQDRESSVVWGMPGSVVEARLADEVLPLEKIGPTLVAKLQKERRHATLRR